MQSLKCKFLFHIRPITVFYQDAQHSFCYYTRWSLNFPLLAELCMLEIVRQSIFRRGEPLVICQNYLSTIVYTRKKKKNNPRLTNFSNFIGDTQKHSIEIYDHFTTEIFGPGFWPYRIDKMIKNRRNCLFYTN